MASCVEVSTLASRPLASGPSTVANDDTDDFEKRLQATLASRSLAPLDLDDVLKSIGDGPCADKPSIRAVVKTCRQLGRDDTGRCTVCSRVKLSGTCLRRLLAYEHCIVHDRVLPATAFIKNEYDRITARSIGIAWRSGYPKSCHEDLLSLRRTHVNPEYRHGQKRSSEKTVRSSPKRRRSASPVEPAPLESTPISTPRVPQTLDVQHPPVSEHARETHGSTANDPSVETDDEAGPVDAMLADEADDALEGEDAPIDAIPVGERSRVLPMERAAIARAVHASLTDDVYERTSHVRRANDLVDDPDFDPHDLTTHLDTAFRPARRRRAPAAPVPAWKRIDVLFPPEEDDDAVLCDDDEVKCCVCLESFDDLDTSTDRVVRLLPSATPMHAKCYARHAKACVDDRRKPYITHPERVDTVIALHEAVAQALKPSRNSAELGEQARESAADGLTSLCRGNTHCFACGVSGATAGLMHTCTRCTRGVCGGTACQELARSSEFGRRETQLVDSTGNIARLCQRDDCRRHASARIDGLLELFQ